MERDAERESPVNSTSDSLLFDPILLCRFQRELANLFLSTSNKVLILLQNGN